jgi:polyisoprenoid-binding protein YceI
MRRRWKWIVGAIAVVVALAVVAPFVYIHLIEGPAPARLALPKVSRSSATSTSTATAAAAATAGVAGAYHVSSGSEAGYRVTEVLVGQHTTAVGRTTKIWGTTTITGSSVTAATFTVNMASVKSDQSGRNAQFDGRIMDVTRYPVATLELTQPIDLGTVPTVGTKASYTATGRLTMHGVTRQVTFPVSAERTTDGIYVLADVHIVFADWDIANPSAGFVTTSSTGTLEVLAHLTKGSGNAPDTTTSSGSTGGVAPTQVTVPKTTVPALSVPSS